MIRSIMTITIAISVSILSIRKVTLTSQDLREIKSRERLLKQANSVLKAHLSSIKDLKIKAPKSRSELMEMLLKKSRRHGLNLNQIRIGPEDEFQLSAIGSFNRIGRFFAEIEKEFPTLEIKSFEIRVEDGKTFFELSGIYHD